MEQKGETPTTGKSPRSRLGLRKALVAAALVGLLLAILKIAGLKPVVLGCVALWAAVVGLLRTVVGPKTAAVSAVATALVAAAYFWPARLADLASKPDHLVPVLSWGCLLGLLGFALLEVALRIAAWADNLIRARTAAIWPGISDKPKRPWYQFSLRTLLLLVLICSLGFAWLAARLQRARENREKAAAIRSVLAEFGRSGISYDIHYPPRNWLDDLFDDPGDRYFSRIDVRREEFGDGDVARLMMYPKGVADLRALDVDGTRVTDAGLAHLKILTSLERLDLAKTRVTDVGLAHLKTLISLERLNLEETQITDAGLAHLKGLASLRGLYLGKTRVSDAGLEHLSGLTKLESLDLSGTQVAGAGLEHLKRCTSLELLDLSGTKVSGPGLEHLERLTSLHRLRLGGAEVSDAGLEHVKGLVSLKELGLSGTGVTGPGLEHLKPLTSLRALYLWNTPITDAGIRHLGEINRLERLELGGANITDAGLKHLKRLKELRSLNLRDTQVTDAGLKHLRALTSLRHLELYNTKVTDAGMSDLKRALPDLRILPLP